MKRVIISGDPGKRIVKNYETGEVIGREKMAKDLDMLRMHLSQNENIHIPEYIREALDYLMYDEALSIIDDVKVFQPLPSRKKRK